MIRAPLSLPALVSGQSQATPVKFNARSEELLSEVNPNLATLLRRVEARMPDAFEISEGLRDPERQAELVAAGKSQTMNSKHLHGNAVDIYAEGPGGSATWDFETYRPIADTAKAEAAATGLGDFVWGGDWNTLKDGVHFQIGGPSGAPHGTHGTPVPPAIQQAQIAALFGLDPLGLPPQPERTAMVRAEQQMPIDQKQRRLALADLIRF